MPTVKPARASVYAATAPPAPEPMTTKSNTSSMGRVSFSQSTTVPSGSDSSGRDSSEGSRFMRRSSFFLLLRLRFDDHGLPTEREERRLLGDRREDPPAHRGISAIEERPDGLE